MGLLSNRSCLVSEMIVSRTPLRISLVGGGTDVPAFYEKQAGCVVSFAINKYIYIMVNDKFDGKYRVSYSKTENVENISQIQHPLVKVVLASHFGSGLFKSGIEIASIADIPGEGSGLGSSSSFTVGLLNSVRMYQGGIETMDSEKDAIAKAAFRLEQKVNNNIGMQDHCAAAFGGFHRYDFGAEGLHSRTEVSSRFDCSTPWSWNDLHKYMLLLWTGYTRSSRDILSAQQNGFASGKTLEYGKDLYQVAVTFHENLIRGRIERAAKIMGEGWAIKKKLAPGISNNWIDKWHEQAMNNGAWGGKLCGAGGGGFLFFFAPPDTHDRIVKATGLRRVDFNLDHEGSVIIRREGYGEF